MKAVVVYESLWGNTGQIAKAIADGLGGDAVALTTAQATPEALAGVDLVIAGAPVIAFNLTNENTRPRPGSLPPGMPKPDVSHPMMRSWLAELPAGSGRCAAFETRVRGPFGHTTKTIRDMLESKGYACVADPLSAIVTGKYGPLKTGETDRARAWGAALAAKLG